MRRFITATACLLSTSAFATPDDAKLGMLTFSAWECHIFASQAGDQAESERLFNLGLEVATEFTTKLRAGKIDRQDTFQHTPMSILGVVQGPNDDFVVGRIYQMIGSSAFDEIAKKGSDGSTLEVKDWITDPATLKSIAETKFRQANCSMIKR